MSYRSFSQMGPRAIAPPPLKILIGTTLAMSLCAALYAKLQLVLALTLAGIHHLYLWQPLTYLFVHPTLGGISFPFLIHLAFNMYLLWTFGSTLYLRSRPAAFFSLYFGSGLFAALVALGTMSLFGLPYALAGSSTAIYALLIAWMLLNPDAEILLFFALPIKARWLILGLIGANLLIDLSNRDWISLFSYLGSSLFGYLFTVLVWKEQSPFTFLRPFERMLLRNLERIRHFGRKKPLAYRPSKIYDIRSGKPLLDDDQFMDACLAKVSLYGEEALTPEEKKRMQEISGRKAAQRK